MGQDIAQPFNMNIAPILNKLPTVKVWPLQPHCFAFGGFEVQMLRSMEASRSLGLEITELNPWSRDDNFQLLQIWGFESCQSNIADWACLNGKKVVLTALLPFSTWHLALRARLGLTRYSSLGLAKLARNLDALVVVSEEQKRSAYRLLALDEAKIHVIPNVVNEAFFNAKRMQIASAKKRIVCVGNICRRKNQIALMHAAQDLPCKLIFIGAETVGEESYFREFTALVNSRQDIEYKGALPYASAELVGELGAAHGCALVSHDETQPISLLEAAAARLPALVSNSKWAGQKYFEHFIKCESRDIRKIKEGLLELLNRPSVSESPYVWECSAELVGRAYIKLYQNLCAEISK